MFKILGNNVEDLCMLSGPSNSSITSCLVKRGESELIYTSIGDVLISVNPYKYLPIFGQEHINLYRNSGGTGGDPQPHIFKLAEEAYSSLCDNGESQCTIISGESGAGKTVAAKYILQYITAVSPTGSETIDHIKQVINDTNMMLEAFGNAKTIRNDNSSRFGKYLEIQFNQEGSPVGGLTTTFLLEKSRVAFSQKNERNFHIFYQMIAGADRTMMDEFGVSQDPSFFRCLNLGNCVKVDNVDDRADYELVRKGFQVCGLGDYEYTICQILSAILWIGNIEFEEGGDSPAQPLSQEPIQYAAWLLGISEEDLLSCINHRLIQAGGARGSSYNVPQNYDQANGLRNALMKTLYSRVFDFIISSLNSTMATREGGCVVGVLDIYGFEIFDNNSFEQFCINYVNEKLQQIFIDLTVRGEQKEYHEEGLAWNDISFFDNNVVCQLIEGSNPVGIMRCMDDTVRTNHAEDSKKADMKLMEKLAKLQHAHLIGATKNSWTFTIKHYAGEVEYNVDGMSFKNKDEVYSSMISCMKSSNVELIQSMFPESGSSKAAPSTASTNIRQSANALVKKLSSCTPHYVRCIKSNDKKMPLSFNSTRIEHQVKYLGLLENVKVRRAGFAYRHYKHVFLNRFGALFEPAPTTIPEFVQMIAQRGISADEFKEGKEKIFVRTPETIFSMEEMLFQHNDPEAYQEKVKAFKISQKEAKSKHSAAAKHNLKQKCAIM